MDSCGKLTMNDLLFELCAETLPAAQAGQNGGAGRVELCSRLSVGGVTPSLPLLQAVLQTLAIPVHALIRPRAGDFVYSLPEFELMGRQIALAKQSGAAGVVLGVLQPDHRVDVARTRALAELAAPMKVTFHRAFDSTPNLEEALEAVIATGADCLLTSGGEADVLTGVDTIAVLQKQARGRIDVMAGGGLTLANLVETVRRTGVSHLHGSLIGKRGDESGPSWHTPLVPAALEADVREAVRLFAMAADLASATQAHGTAAKPEMIGAPRFSLVSGANDADALALEGSDVLRGSPCVRDQHLNLATGADEGRIDLSQLAGVDRNDDLF